MTHSELVEQGRQRRAAILGFIRTFRDERGFSPSHAEIADAVGPRSPNALSSHLQQLEEAGSITRTPGVARSIVPVDA